MSVAGNIVKQVHTWLRGVDLRGSAIVKVGITAVLVVLIVSLFPRGESMEYDCDVGAIWTRADVVAPFSFPIQKDELQYRREKEQAAKSVFPVFERSGRSVESDLDSINRFFVDLKTVLDLQIEHLKRGIPSQANGRRVVRTLLEDSVKLSNMIANLGLSFTPAEWNTLIRIRSEELKQRREIGELSLDRFRRTISTVAKDLLEVGVLDLNRDQINRDSVALRTNREEQLVSVSKFLDMSAVSSRLQDVVENKYAAHSEVINPLLKIGVTLIGPNILYDYQQTIMEIKIVQDRVPPTLGVVREGERILRTHDKVTPEIKQKLDSLRKAKAERSGDVNQMLQNLGKGGHVILVLMLFAIYLFLFRKRVLADNYLLSLIALLILMEVFFAYLTYHVQSKVPLEYLILVPIASMLLTIIFDSRLAFYGTVIIALLVAGVRGNDYSTALASLVAGALAVYTVRDIKNRTQIFRSLLFILLGYGLIIISLGLERYESLNAVMDSLAIASLNAVFSPILTYGLLVFFEKAFNVTTDVTLLELSNFNHPLLRELSAQAPGTFHHSVVIGSLAEAAAEAIGANALLARVGAYYHDIGKIDKPEYFVENQMGSKSKHDRLTPSMSTLILVSHVKEGVELGKKYRLPQRILDFIPMHHGSTLMSYFYQKALRKRSRKQEVREIDFRYPGPKPQTKETGIVMLADAVEAAARSIEEPTVQKLEGVSDDVIKQRFMDGQLDECELTIRDLTKIKESFLKTLIGIHHPRIKYPGPEEEVQITGEEKREERRATPPQEEKQEDISKETESEQETPVAPSSPESLEKRIKAIDEM
jgi:putative nucleotidyltransferase with HDIG domain